MVVVGLMLLDLAISWGYTGGSRRGEDRHGVVDPRVLRCSAPTPSWAASPVSPSLRVIVMEMSGETLLLPILLGITVAKWTADFLHKPLYHALLEVKSAPFLPDEPAGAPGLHLHDVSEIMRPAPLTTLRERESVNTLRRALKETSHQGFPVVRHVDGVGEVLVGLVSRAHLRVLLRAAASSEASAAETPIAAPESTAGRANLASTVAGWDTKSSIAGRTPGRPRRRWRWWMIVRRWSCRT